LSTPTTAISIANTMNVYVRRRASRTIHMGITSSAQMSSRSMPHTGSVFRRTGLAYAVTYHGPAAVSGRHHRCLVRRDVRHDRLVDLQVRPHQLVWGEPQPLPQRHVGELVGLPQLEELQLRRARVLDVVAHVPWHEADVAGLVVEGARPGRGGEDRHPGLAGDVVLHLVGVRVPVDLAHAAGL